MSLHSPHDAAISILSRKPVFQPITPFHIREQIWDLFYGDQDVAEKMYHLVTTSHSPWKIRERLWAFMASQAKDCDDTACPEEKISIQEVQTLLLEKLKDEGKKGFHFGLIADGNRRWAKANGLLKTIGHQEGFKRIKDTIFSLIVKIPQITEFSIYLLSCSNLDSRDKDELENIYKILRDGHKDLLESAKEHKFKYRHAGEKQRLPKDIQDLLRDLETQTEENNGIIIHLCINYDSELEYGRAARKLALSKSHEDIEKMSDREYAREIQKRSWIITPMDAAIRTGGDDRFSGFLGNRPCDANCHLLSEKKCLPAITKQDLLAQIHRFATGERRMGK
ncbi:undecaprenyl diphosphate synthase family protein [Candidatus Peregrinibacteria bacterium]|nr:undecaprenyl diphosphate synthase family protein [Candidatus Peregrinibacteria bacterium]